MMSVSQSSIPITLVIQFDSPFPPYVIIFYKPLLSLRLSDLQKIGLY